MALNLDARQRAMLQDMGITVWLPRSAPAAASAPVAAVEQAPTPVQVPAHVTAHAPVAPAPAQPQAALQAPAPMAPAVPPSAVVAPSLPHAPAPAVTPQPAQVPTTTPATATWWAAPLVHAYAQGPHTPTDDAGWLVLLECADPLDPWAGDSGTLLNNMLRALRLHHHAQVRIAPLTRQAPSDAAQPDWQPLAPAIEQAITTHRPARVLLMGLHAARAVLGRSEALGPLRAVVHQLHNTPTVVTYDPAYLLRAPHAKPGAWADMCRAHALQPPLRS